MRYDWSGDYETVKRKLFQHPWASSYCRYSTVSWPEFRRWMGKTQLEWPSAGWLSLNYPWLVTKPRGDEACEYVILMSYDIPTGRRESHTIKTVSELREWIQKMEGWVMYERLTMMEVGAR